MDSMFGKRPLFSFAFQLTAVERKNLRIVILVGLIVSFFTTTFSQAEDMGFFLSVSGFVSQGYKLYAETFEIKDPLFLYSNAIAIKTLGIVGPFYLDFFITAAILPIAYLLAMELTKSNTASFLAAFLFQLTATGEFGQSLRSQIMAIFFILLSTYFGLKQRWLLAGIVASLVLFSKMPLLSVIGIILLTLHIFDRKLRSLLLTTLGFSISSSLILLTLAMRGELVAYVDMVKENFSYASTYQMTVGQTQGIMGHFLVWNGNEQRFTTFIISIIWITYIAVKNRVASKRFFLFVISTNIGVGFFLLNTAMWAHHLQIISLYIFANSLFILSFFNLTSLGSESNSKESSVARRTQSDSISKLAVSTIVLCLLISNSGATLKSKPEMSLKNWTNPVWSTPLEIEMLSQVRNLLPEGGSFARLGMNDDLGFGTFLTPEWTFVCKRHGIFGYEPIPEMVTFLNCLKKVPDLILIAPFYQNQSNRTGNYQYFYPESQRILREEFACVDYKLDYRFCLRK